MNPWRISDRDDGDDADADDESVMDPWIRDESVANPWWIRESVTNPWWRRRRWRWRRRGVRDESVVSPWWIRDKSVNLWSIREGSVVNPEWIRDSVIHLMTMMMTTFSRFFNLSIYLFIYLLFFGGGWHSWTFSKATKVLREIKFTNLEKGSSKYIMVTIYLGVLYKNF